MNGYPCDEVVGRSLTALVDPGAHDLLDEFASATKSRGKLRRRILSLRKDGTSFPADLQGTVIVGEDQPLILGVVRDISEQVRANDLLEGRVADAPESWRPCLRSHITSPGSSTSSRC